LHLKDLNAKREKITALLLTPKESIEYYSKINDNLLKIVANVAKISKSSQVTQDILAYINFLYAKENAGIERAIGAIILSDCDFLNTNRVEFIKLIAMQDLYMKKIFQLCF